MCFVILASHWGLFLGGDDPRKGLWLDESRRLDYFMLQDGVGCNTMVFSRQKFVEKVKINYYFKDQLEYRSRYRLVKIRTLDGVQKTLQLDDNLTVADVLVSLCRHLGKQVIQVFALNSGSFQIHSGVFHYGIVTVLSQRQLSKHNGSSCQNTTE